MIKIIAVIKTVRRGKMISGSIASESSSESVP